LADKHLPLTRPIFRQSPWSFSISNGQFPNWRLEIENNPRWGVTSSGRESAEQIILECAWKAPAKGVKPLLTEKTTHTYLRSFGYGAS